MWAFGDNWTLQLLCTAIYKSFYFSSVVKIILIIVSVQISRDRETVLEYFRVKKKKNLEVVGTSLSFNQTFIPN